MAAAGSGGAPAAPPAPVAVSAAQADAEMARATSMHARVTLMPALSKADSLTSPDALAARHADAVATAIGVLAVHAPPGVRVGQAEARAALRQPEARFDPSALADVLERDARRAALLRAIGFQQLDAGDAPPPPGRCLTCDDVASVPMGACGHACLCDEHAGGWLSSMLQDGAMPPFACPLNLLRDGAAGCRAVVSDTALAYAATHMARKPDGPRLCALLAAAQRRRAEEPDEAAADMLRCPSRACGAYVAPSEAESSAYGGLPSKPSVACGACGTRFCRACPRVPHFPLPCELWLDFKGNAARIEHLRDTLRPSVQELLTAIERVQPGTDDLGRAGDAAVAAAVAAAVSGPAAAEAAEAAEALAALAAAEAAAVVAAAAAQVAAAAAAEEETAAAASAAAAPAPPAPLSPPPPPPMSAADAEAASAAAVARISKECPRCGVPIQREGGCNSMRCPRCDEHFCFHCGGPAHHHARGDCGGAPASQRPASWESYDPGSEREREVQQQQQGLGDEAARARERRHRRAQEEYARLLAEAEARSVRAWLVAARARVDCGDAHAQAPSPALVAACLGHLRAACADMRTSRAAATSAAAAHARGAEDAEAAAHAALARAADLLAFLHAHRFYEAAGALRDSPVRSLLGTPPAAPVLSDPTQRLLSDEGALRDALAALRDALLQEEEEEEEEEARRGAAPANAPPPPPPPPRLLIGRAAALVQQRRQLELGLLEALGGHKWVQQQLLARLARDDAACGARAE
jgi:hypothetical protein